MQNSALSLFSVENEEGKERLALENAAVCDVGYLYVIFTYIFEGDDPLILSAYPGFKNLTLPYSPIGVKISNFRRLVMKRGRSTSGSKKKSVLCLKS